MPIYRRVNKDFFKKWTPNMAYILGFFAADGYMTINKRGGHFWSIQINDKHLLEEIRKEIKSEHKISKRMRKLKSEKTSYRLQIGSSIMFQDLYELSMRPNKTRSMTVPKVPDQFFCHFLRGYFDGDGHVWTGQVHKERKAPLVVIRTVFTSCSRKFLESIKGRLDKKGISRGVLSVGKGNFYRLTYSVESSLKIFEFMYNNLGSSKLFLHRKKVIFERYKRLRA